MKLSIIIPLLLFAQSLFAQAAPIALPGKIITSLAFSESMNKRIIFAGTEDYGLYYHYLHDDDSVWNPHYFSDRTITSLYVQKVGAGPADYSRIFAGVKMDSVNESFIFKTDFPIQSFWSPIDSGIFSDDNNYISSFTAFNYSGHEPPKPVFALDRFYLYRWQIDHWEIVRENSL